MLNLEICIQLKKVGFPYKDIPEKGEFPSPTFDEIWAQLPNEIWYDNTNYSLNMTRLKEKSHTCISYRYILDKNANAFLLQRVAHSPVDAAAQMWLLWKQTDFTIIKSEN